MDPDFPIHLADGLPRGERPLPSSERGRHRPRVDRVAHPLSGCRAPRLPIFLTWSATEVWSYGQRLLSEG
jgi:hypothetical protein